MVTFTEKFFIENFFCVQRWIGYLIAFRRWLLSQKAFHAPKYVSRYKYRWEIIHLVRACAYQGVRNVSFLESLAYLLNGWSLLYSALIVGGYNFMRRYRFFPKLLKCGRGVKIKWHCGTFYLPWLHIPWVSFLCVFTLCFLSFYGHIIAEKIFLLCFMLAISFS